MESGSGADSLADRNPEYPVGGHSGPSGEREGGSFM